MGWVKPGRRRETPGRPLTWITTSEFLDQFGLESIMELPGLDDLKASGLLDRRPAAQALPSSGDLFDNQDDESFDDEDAEEEEFEEELEEI
jgi:segregation and condensation protein B